jgi:integrase
VATKFTDLQAKAAKPRDKLYRLPTGTPGLRLSVQPTGTKFWSLSYRFGGKEKMISLGLYPFVSVKDAETRAHEARVLLARGVNPSEQRRQEKLALRTSEARTFGQAANDWYKLNCARWKPATQEKVRQYLDKDLLPPLRTRPLANITPLELGAVVERIEKRQAFNVAKKARQWLWMIFEFARAKGLASANPAEHLAAAAAPAPAPVHHAHLSIDALPAFLRALDGYAGSPLVKAATWLALWTANRPGMVRTVRWSELDLEAGVWTIPKGREGMKRGYEHVTPLPRQAVAMLRQLREATGGFEHVFVGRNDFRKPISGGAIGQLLKAIGYGGKQTAHGFRHMVSTALNERGYKADWVERQLAHGDPDQVRDTYNKATYLQQRRKMMQAWADYLDEIKSGAPTRPRKNPG